MRVCLAWVIAVMLLPGCKLRFWGSDEPSTPAAADGAEPVGGGYPLCSGQRQPDAKNAPTSGPVTAQLAPAFLDEMPNCAKTDLPPLDLIEKAANGRINAKGDCEFATIGASCHYHTGTEFTFSNMTRQPPGTGELHCIFPSKEAASPKVFGARIVCRDKAQGYVREGQHASHHVRQGDKCDPRILHELKQCSSFRCCDEGTLTNPIGDLIRDQRNSVRPDFRICADVIEVDCSLLVNFTGHPANSPAFGGVGTATFGITARADED